MFKEKLKELIEKEDITVYRLSKDIGVNKQTISNYIEGKNVPTIDKAIKIADYFSVSLDWLISDKEENIIKETNLDYKEMYDKVIEDLNKSLLKNNELYEENRNLRIQLEEIKSKESTV